jgi:hypothetical protein
MDLILGDKGRNIGEAHAGLYKTVRKLVVEDYISVLKTFFDIERFETRTKRSMFILSLMAYQYVYSWVKNANRNQKLVKQEETRRGR